MVIVRSLERMKMVMSTSLASATLQDLLEEMNQEKSNYLRPGTYNIIVKKLTKEIVTEVIQAYAEDDGY